jgi:hypothetical protein
LLKLRTLQSILEGLISRFLVEWQLQLVYLLNRACSAKISLGVRKTLLDKEMHRNPEREILSHGNRVHFNGSKYVKPENGMWRDSQHTTPREDAQPRPALNSCVAQ